MSSEQAARILGMQVSSLITRVREGKLRPASGDRPSSWRFTADEIERFRARRDAGNAKRREWNGSRAGSSWDECAVLVVLRSRGA